MTPNELRARLQPFPGASEALDLMDENDRARGMTPPLRQIDEIDKLATMMTLCRAMMTSIMELHRRCERSRMWMRILGGLLLTDLAVRIWQAAGQ